MTRKNITSLATVVVAGTLLWAFFVVLDYKNPSPAEAAVSFARAFYRLDPSLAQFMVGSSSATCANCTCGKESATCVKTDCKQKTSGCAKEDSAIESEDRTKSASGQDSANCAKAASNNETVPCPNAKCGNESPGCSNTDCCKRMARRVNTAVENYLYAAKEDAAERGFGANFAKYTLSHIETRTEHLDDATAVVHLTAHRRVSINPLYAYIARLFRIGETYKVDAKIRVELEDGHWRVCMSSLSSLKTS